MKARAVALASLLTGCAGQLDAGSNSPRGELPVDDRSAVVVVNDGPRDNWQAEYAFLLAASNRILVAGLVVNSSIVYPNLEENVGGFRRLVQAARASGMQGIPDVTASVAPALVRPSSGLIEDTVPNRSEGARAILAAADRYGSAVHPLVIATGGATTDAADAYLMDPTLADRAVVVSSLGNTEDSSVHSGTPNGDFDAWATTIIVSRMPFVQVNGYYDQLQDVPEARVAELPANAFGTWITEKRPEILDLIVACDQISVLAAARAWFATRVVRMRPDTSEVVPTLRPDADGSAWLVAETDSEGARAELWSLLQDSRIFR